MTSELISTLNPVHFVPHRSDKLDEVRLLLTSNVDGVADKALRMVTDEEIERDPLSVLSICIALVEVNCWQEANQATAFYLQHKPSDENAIALLAFSLASFGEFEQAHIIISRALNFLEQRRLYLDDVVDQETRLHLDSKMELFKKLEYLILQNENPAEFIFTDQETLNLSMLQPVYPNGSFSEYNENFADMNHLPTSTDTIRDVNIQAYLQHIDQLVEQTPTEQLDKKNTLNQNYEDEAPTSLISSPQSKLHEHDTMLNHINDLDDHLKEDHITEILRDVEARERQTERIKIGFQHTAIEPQTPTDLSSNEITNPSSSSLELLNTEDTNVGSEFLSQIEYLSDLNDFVALDSDLSELSGSVGESSSESSLIIESTERMKSLSNIMLEEERKRIDSILKEEVESLVVPSSLEPSPRAILKPIADPLLYPIDPSLSLNILGPTQEATSSNKDHWNEAQDIAANRPKRPPIPPMPTHPLDEGFRPPKPPLPPIPKAKNIPANDHQHPASPFLVPPLRPQGHSSSSHQPLSSSDSSELNKRSALERLSAGELNIPVAPPPLVSLPQPPPAILQEPTPNRRARSTIWRGPTARTKDPLHSWGLWLVILIASYLSLMSAFHSKSAHIIHKMTMNTNHLDWSEYKSLQSSVSNTVNHPIGQTIDWLKQIVPNNSLSIRREALSHQLAWISTARWVFFGKDEEQATAIQTIQSALAQAPTLEAGRASLGLAFHALGQPVAALAILQALPEKSWYRSISMGWVELDLGRLESGQAKLIKSIKSDPLNLLAAHKLALLTSKTGLAHAQKYLHQLKRSPSSSTTHALYMPQSIENETLLITPKLITYLQTLPPQLQRDHFDHLIIELIRREDRLGLQNLIKGLSLGEDSPVVLLLPTLLGSLSELNLSQADRVYDQIIKKGRKGQIHIDDYAKAVAIWSLFTGVDRQHLIKQTEIPTPPIVRELGAFSGQQVAKLITPTTKPSDLVRHDIESLLLLHQKKWVGLERVTDSAQSSKSVQDQTLNHLARAHLSANYSGAEPAFKALSNYETNALGALFTQPKILHGIITSAFDPINQGVRHFQLMDQEMNIPALKWLSRFWQCQSLSQSSNLGRLQTACLSAKQLNPRDYKSTQTLAYTFLETGKVLQASQLLDQIPLKSLSNIGRQLRLRLDKDSHYQDQDQGGSQSFVELLSAERGLRLNAFNRLVESQLQELSRHELYRATWVAEYLGSEEVFSQIISRASHLGSLLVTIDHTRRQLFQQYALDNQSKTKPKISLSNEEIMKVNSEPNISSFISTFDALSCLAEKKKLDPHHFHPDLLKNLPQSKDAFSPLIRNTSSSVCRYLITESLSQLKDQDPSALPLLRLSQAQLLISLGQGERAERLLKTLIEQEPTLIEARVAYALLLFRSSSSPNIAEVRWSMAPLLDPSQEVRRIKSLKSKLYRLEVGR